MASPGAILSAPRENKANLLLNTVFEGLASEVTHHHFYHVLLITQASLIQCGRELHKGVNTRKWRQSGAILEDDSHISLYSHLPGITRGLQGCLGHSPASRQH